MSFLGLAFLDFIRQRRLPILDLLDAANVLEPLGILVDDLRVHDVIHFPELFSLLLGVVDDLLAVVQALQDHSLLLQ